MKTLAQQLEGRVIVEDANESLSRGGLPAYEELVALLERTRTEECDHWRQPLRKDIAEALTRIHRSVGR